MLSSALDLRHVSWQWVHDLKATVCCMIGQTGQADQDCQVSLCGFFDRASNSPGFK
jgi:hypothetical protein